MTEQLDSISDPMPHVTDCQMAVGWVIFDCVCLAVGAVGVRASATGETIEEIAKLSIKVATPIEAQIEIIAHTKATSFQKARAVFNILLTLKNGGMLGAIFAAFVGSLKWWQMLLYAATGLGTILAALATDGMAFVAEVAILVVTFAWLLADSVKAVKICTLTPQMGPVEDTPISPFQNPLPYLPQGAFMTANGSFISVLSNIDDDGTAAFSTNRTVAKDWEKFTIEPVDADKQVFAIKTHSGKYISAVNGGGQAGTGGTNWAVRTDANSIGPAEVLVIQMNEDGTYSLMTPQGYYVTAYHGGNVETPGDPMRTNAETIGVTEMFSMQMIQNDGVSAERYRVSSQSMMIRDPGFETPILGDGHYQYRPTSSPWTFTNGSGITANNSGFTHKNPPAPEGTQVAFIQENGTIKQTITTAPGSYVISFYAAQRAGYGTNTFQVSVDDNEIYECQPQDTNYRPYTTPSFEVAGGHHILKFHGLNPTGKDTTCFVDLVVASYA